jgi:hypothetical protein
MTTIGGGGATGGCRMARNGPVSRLQRLGLVASPAPVSPRHRGEATRGRRRGDLPRPPGASPCPNPPGRVL